MYCDCIMLDDSNNLLLLTPEFVLAGLALVVFTADLFIPENKKEWVGRLAAFGLLGVGLITVSTVLGVNQYVYNGFLLVDHYSFIFKMVFIGVGFLVILMSEDYVKNNLTSQGEFYGLILFAILGMNILIQSQEFLTAYISLELLSFCLYVLVGYAKFNPKSNEASIKYIIFGTFSSAILLYGLSMVYSVVGSTVYSDISNTLLTTMDPVAAVGVAFIMIGIGFKVGIVPFHSWIPDVYEGAPIPVTAYLAIGAKIAAFAFLVRVVIGILLPAEDFWESWQMIFAALAVSTMIVGNGVAIVQTKVKRMLAYSSIGHSGVLLAGIVVLGSTNGVILESLGYYLIGYTVTSFSVFSAITAITSRNEIELISEFSGLSEQKPLLSASIAMGLFSLAGLPLFVGFTIKFYLFSSIAIGGFLWLAGIAVLASLVSLYYYLILIKSMYVDASVIPGVHKDIIVSWPMRIVILLSVLATILFGVYPEPVIDQIHGISNLLSK